MAQVAQDDASGADESALLRLLMDSVQDYAIFMLDPEGRVLTWNPGAQRIKGYHKQEIVGRHFSVFYSVEDRPQCDRELEMALRDGRFEVEGFRLRKDGSQFWANVVITPLRDATGLLRGFAKVTRDLSDRIRREQEQLELARAEDAQRRRDEFLAIMGHELRNPLAPMVTAVHLLKRKPGIGGERELAVIDRQLAHMKRLVDDLLDASRLSRGVVRLDRRVVEIAAIVQQSVEVARPMIEKRGQALSLRLDTPGLLVHADVDRMVQVVGNLLNNASKFTPEGGHLEVTVAGDRGWVTVAVRDDGAGMSPELLPRVFDLFSQGSQAADRKQGGLGIGLAVARGIAVGHGGDLVAHSAGEGRGSTFSLRIPRAHSMLADVGSATPGVGFPLPRRVHLITQGGDEAELFRSSLVARGHQVESTLDGATALASIREQRPHVVLIDLELPQREILDVTRAIRLVPGCESTTLIGLGPRPTVDEQRRLLEAGFVDLLDAPVAPDRVVRCVETAPLARAG